MTYSLIKTITESDDELYRSGQSYPNNAEAKVLVYREGNTTNNYSNVRTEIWEKRLSSYVSFNYNTPASMKIYGTSYSSNVSFREIDRYVWQKVWENTKKYIYHKSDGTRTINIEAAFNTGTSDVGNIVLDSIAIELPTIPRASNPSLDDSSVMMRDQVVTVNTNRLSTAFKHTIKYSFGSATGTIGTDVTDSVTWTPPIDLANQISNAISGNGTITCETYYGDDLIGTKSIPITLSIPSDIVPTIDSASNEEAVSGLAAKFGGYVQGKSKINAVMTASGAYGSTIQSNTIKIDGITYVGLGVTSEFLQSSGSIVIEYTVKDSRNRTATTIVSVSVFAYSNPSPTALAADRCDATGIPDAEGSYARVDVQAAISSVGDNNDIAYRIKYKKTTESTYTTVNLTSTAYSIDISSILSSIDVNNRYDIVLEVQDYFMTATRDMVLPTAFTLADFLADGTGVAWGKVAENSDEFDVNLASRFRKHVILSTFESPTLGSLTSLITSVKDSIVNAINEIKGNINAIMDDDNHIRLNNDGDASKTSTDHPFQCGNTDANNIRMDGNEIFCVNNGAYADMFLQGIKFSKDDTTGDEDIDINANPIVARGSNSNGYYVRFYDGTQICWYYKTITPVADTPTKGTVQFPVAFSSTPYVVPTPSTTQIGKYVMGVSVYNRSTTGCDLYTYRTNTTAFSVLYIAIGRWK